MTGCNTFDFWQRYESLLNYSSDNQKTQRKEIFVCYYYIIRGWFNKQSRVISTWAVNSPLDTIRERGLASCLLLTCWQGGCCGPYFYCSYHLSSVEHHKVKQNQKIHLNLSVNQSLNLNLNHNFNLKINHSLNLNLEI